MKNNIYIYVLGMVLITIPKLYAQLGSIGSFSTEVRALYADSSTQKLYIAAQPPSFYDSKPTFGLAYYDFVTSTRDTMPTADFRLASIYSINRADSFLYFAGGFDTLGGNTIRSYIKYDGQNWVFSDPGYFLNTPMGGNMDALYYDGDSILYMGAGSTKFIGPFNNGIIGRNIKTNSWVNLPVLDNSSNFSFVSTISHYQGDLYVCGHFKLPGNQGYGIARLVNNTWQKLGAGIPTSWVFEDMVEYNGQLIVAGGTSYIMVWNGVQWSNSMALPAVGPFFARVYDLEVYNGVLYAAGLFTLPDGSRNIAKWDGNSWVGIGLTSFTGSFGDGFVNSIQIYNNTLYMGGGFDSINGQPFTNLAKFDNLVSVEELATPNENLKSYPNPVQDNLTIVCPVGWENQMVNIYIYNTMGQKVYSVEAKIANGKANISHLLNLSQGMYVVLLQNEKVQGRTVMIKK